MNLVKAAPNDGYTMTLAQAAVLVVTPFTYKEATYDAERDFDSVAMVGISPMVFVANPNHPAKNLTEAIAMVRAKPEAVSVGNPTRTSIPPAAFDARPQWCDCRNYTTPPSESRHRGIPARSPADRPRQPMAANNRGNRRRCG